HARDPRLAQGERETKETRLRRIALLAAILALGAGFGLARAADKKEFGPKKLPFKIGLMTGTVSQGEDEYRGAESVVRAYGKDAITHVTYPDSFMAETETTI